MVHSNHKSHEGRFTHVERVDFSMYEKVFQIVSAEDAARKFPGHDLKDAWGKGEEERAGGIMQHSDQDNVFHGLLVRCDSHGEEWKYQPWGSKGRPLCDRFMTAFNVAVWLLYEVLRPHLTAVSIENLAMQLPLPVAGHLLLFAVRQGHCEQDSKGRLFLRGWCCLSGVQFTSDTVIVDHVVRDAMDKGVRGDTLGSAMLHCGLNALLAQCLPDDIDLANAILYHYDLCLVDTRKNALGKAEGRWWVKVF